MAHFGPFEGAVGTVTRRLRRRNVRSSALHGAVAPQIPAVTGTLTIRFRSPTPLLTELLLQGKAGRVERRKIFTRATMSANGIVTAEAEGLFIATK